MSLREPTTSASNSTADSIAQRSNRTAAETTATAHECTRHVNQPRQPLHVERVTLLTRPSNSWRACSVDVRGSASLCDSRRDRFEIVARRGRACAHVECQARDRRFTRRDAIPRLHQSSRIVPVERSSVGRRSRLVCVRTHSAADLSMLGRWSCISLVTHTFVHGGHRRGGRSVRGRNE
jgi:hypothetical protein